MCKESLTRENYYSIGNEIPRSSNIYIILQNGRLNLLFIKASVTLWISAVIIILLSQNLDAFPCNFHTSLVIMCYTLYLLLYLNRRGWWSGADTCTWRWSGADTCTWRWSAADTCTWRWSGADTCTWRWSGADTCSLHGGGVQLIHVHGGGVQLIHVHGDGVELIHVAYMEVECSWYMYM